MRNEIEQTIGEISEFVYSPKFYPLVQELRSLPIQEHKRFVRDIIINREELVKRGINVPEGMIVQRSVFGDNRPTLFCVTKYLKEGNRKVTVTIDDSWA